MVLDAAAGTIEGVRSLAQVALAVGARKAFVTSSARLRLLDKGYSIRTCPLVPSRYSSFYNKEVRR